MPDTDRRRVCTHPRARALYEQYTVDGRRVQRSVGRRCLDCDLVEIREGP